MIEVSVQNESPYDLPAYATSASAGVDLRAVLEAPLALKPLERKIIGTGLKIALPEGYEAQVRPRSGLAAKHGISVLNAPGTIDADYRDCPHDYVGAGCPVSKRAFGATPHH